MIIIGIFVEASEEDTINNPKYLSKSASQIFLNWIQMINNKI